VLGDICMCQHVKPTAHFFEQASAGEAGKAPGASSLVCLDMPPT
jgi:hypothetical protein